MRINSVLLTVTSLLTTTACSVAADQADQANSPHAASAAPLLHRSDAVYALRSVYSNQVLDAVALGTANSTRIQQWAPTGGGNQQWRLHDLGNGTFEIIGVASNRCLDLAAGQTNDGAVIQLWDCWGGTPQQWRLTAASTANGAPVVLTNAGSGKCVDISGPSTADGALAQQWSCWTGATNQQFILDPVGGGSSSTSTSTSTPTVTNRPHVSGNQLLDAQGNPLRLHGVNIPSLEWGNGEPNAGSSPCWAGQSIHDSVHKALTDYQVNFVRLPISQDRWWNAVDGQGAAYRATVDAIVQEVTGAGAVIDVDLHWSDQGNWGQNIGQHLMPDDNTLTVLTDVAAHYASNPLVFVGVYNEPHDVDWNTWRNGGTVTENGVTYHTPGIEAMVNSLRQISQTVFIVGGLDWSFDLTGLVNGAALSDDNILYDAHVYPWKGNTDSWDRAITVIADRHPVLIGEFGADYTQLSGFATPQDFITTMHGWLDAHNYSYSAWDLHPQATPSLISDWCYTPTPYFGAVTLPWL